ncbi:IclR family transcriptional regulator [Streptomyces sp. NBC_01218]|uniref:IclR family transcriptional regulator n=1 Tax=unclassified Streptomyces TaxID=2593676 RepID=UPI0023B9740A|nr:MULTISPECIES: IclR family transcriptional regulator [unclassified Streptomyces]WEH38679.1 IclR family transcriptional regulator [Streptomyces sp. AM 2-1-1]WSQ50339.1 IclR family transcriptional regulator [Streptomyces sp. NBC_01218]
MPKSSSSAVDKALDLVEAVSRSDRPLRLSELADAVGLHRPTAYRVLVDLVRRGWVLRSGDHYLPGAAALRLSRTAASHSLVTTARPVLGELAARTGMMVNLQVLEHDRSRVLDAVRPDRLEMISLLTDETLPVHRFAGPLALVAALPPEARAPYLRPAQEAGHPMAGPEGLLADLARVERTGFAVERGRNEALVASVGRAVLAGPGQPLCALTVVGPAAEFDEPSLTALCAALRDAAAAVADLLGVEDGTAPPADEPTGTPDAEGGPDEGEGP